MAKEATHGNDMAGQLLSLRPQLVKSEDQGSLDQPDKAEKTEKPDVVKYTENDKGDASVVLPASMKEAKAIAAEVPKLQRATRFQKYGALAADLGVTALFIVSSIVVMSFAHKGLSAGEE
jgi:hypothetical protein